MMMSLAGAVAFRQFRWMLVAALLGSVLRGGAVTAQVPAEPPLPAAAQAARPAAPSVDWSHVTAVFPMVESWVRATTSASAADEKPVRVANVDGVRVTLRWYGMTIGVGEILADEAPGGGAIDLVQWAATATDRALEDVRGSLDALARKAAAAAPAGSPAPRPMLITELAPKLLVDVQVASGMTSITRGADQPLSAVFVQYAPGYHGLRMSGVAPQGKPLYAWSWPGAVLASNMPQRTVFFDLLRDAGYTRDALEAIGRPGGPRLSRFDVIHMVRPAADEPPVVLVRGNAPLPTVPLSKRSVDAVATRLGLFLAQRQRADGSMTGTYHPTSDQHDPATASIQDTALAVYAMATRAAYLQQRQPGGPQGARTQAMVLRGVDYLTAQLDRFTGPHDAPAAALLLMSMVEAPNLQARKASRDALAARIMDLQSADGSFRAGPDVLADTMPLPSQAIVLASLTRLYGQTREARVLAAVQRGRDWLWQVTEPQELIGALPWLGMVELRINRLAPPADDAAIETANARFRFIDSLIDAAQSLQVGESPAAGPDDVVGGFDLSQTPPGMPPRPDWHTAHLMAFLAEALREPNLRTGRDAAGWLLDTALAGRFLAQMMFDTPSCYYVRNPISVLGGIRAALWDNRLDLAPSALSLIAFTELQRSLTGLSADDLR